MPDRNLAHSPFKPVKVHTTLITRNSPAIHGMVALKAQPDYFPNPNDSTHPTFSGGSELALLKHGLSSDLGCGAFASANAWAEGVSG